MKSLVVFDLEIYPNYFLAAFRSIRSGKVRTYERFNNEEVDFSEMFNFMSNPKFTFVSFNGNGFDMILLSALLNGASNKKLKEICDYIIISGEPEYRVYKQFDIKKMWCVDHIDLCQLPKGKVGLKLYAARMHSKSIIELPYAPDTNLTWKEAQNVKSYCVNDLIVTEDLYRELQDQVELRDKMSAIYEIDLRSKSDAQIAEAVICNKLSKLGVEIKREHNPIRSVTYKAPKYLCFKSPELKQLLIDIQNQPIVIDKKGKYVTPPCFMMDKILKSGKISKNPTNRVIRLGSLEIAMSLGGIHSLESNLNIDAGVFRIIDRDVTSYYPSMILNNRWFPSHLGKEFLTVYKSIVDERVEAKKRKDSLTADALKITVNGTFGKFGSRFSGMYAQDLMYQTTLTGQLSLLMLIEALIDAGHNVVSANTDGVVSLVEDYDSFLEVIKWWERETSLLTEETEYISYFAKDVNNYIAVKKDREVKRKGRFAETSLDKNPLHKVVFDAVAWWVAWGIEPSAYIRSCDKFTDFILATKSNSGCVDSEGVPVGKVVRWYYSTSDSTTLFSASNGNTIPRSTGAKLALRLPDEFPDDIDYDKYIEIAEGLINSVVYEQQQCFIDFED